MPDGRHEYFTRLRPTAQPGDRSAETPTLLYASNDHKSIDRKQNTAAVQETAISEQEISVKNTDTFPAMG